jgi:hypothetical protein
MMTAATTVAFAAGGQFLNATSCSPPLILHAPRYSVGRLIPTLYTDGSVPSDQFWPDQQESHVKVHSGLRRPSAEEARGGKFRGALRELGLKHCLPSTRRPLRINHLGPLHSLTKSEPAQSVKPAGSLASLAAVPTLRRNK